MTYKDFVSSTVNIFADKKAKKEIGKDHRIWRGRAPSASPELEELLSLVVADEIPKDFSLLVDYPLSYKVSGKRAKTIYPDITVIKHVTIVGIIEFKIDLGYLPKDWSEKSLAIFGELKEAKNIKYKKHVGTPKAEESSLSVSDALKRCVVVLTKANDHNRIADFQKSNNCFILCGGEHPNSHDLSMETIKQSIMNSKNDCEKFVTYLKSNFR